MSETFDITEYKDEIACLNKEGLLRPYIYNIIHINDNNEIINYPDLEINYMLNVQVFICYIWCDHIQYDQKYNWGRSGNIRSTSFLRYNNINEITPRVLSYLQANSMIEIMTICRANAFTTYGHPQEAIHWMFFDCHPDILREKALFIDGEIKRMKELILFL